MADRLLQQRVQRMEQRCLAMHTRRIDRAVVALFDAAGRPHGVTSQQVTLLCTITGYALHEGPPRASTVAGYLDMDLSTLSRNVGVLQKAGWVTSGPDPEDGRARLLNTTAAGRAKIHAFWPDWERTQAEAERLLGEAAEAVIRASRDRS